MSKPLVYIACPYSSDPEGNVKKALAIASILRDEGIVTPFVPVLTHYWELQFPAPYETWLDMDFDYLERCRAVLRLPGDSPGADREVHHALEHSIPVFRDLITLYEHFGVYGGVYATFAREFNWSIVCYNNIGKPKPLQTLTCRHSTGRIARIDYAFAKDVLESDCGGFQEYFPDISLEDYKQLVELVGIWIEDVEDDIYE